VHSIRHTGEWLSLMLNPMLSLSGLSPSLNGLSPTLSSLHPTLSSLKSSARRLIHFPISSGYFRQHLLPTFVHSCKLSIEIPGCCAGGMYGTCRLAISGI
jgi:hypothetical protein